MEDFEKFKEWQEAMAKENKNKFNNANLVNYILFVVITTVLVVSVLALYQYYKNGVLPPDQLIMTLFGVLGGELLAMAGIAISKNIGKEKEEEYYE